MHTSTPMEQAQEGPSFKSAGLAYTKHHGGQEQFCLQLTEEEKARLQNLEAALASTKAVNKRQTAKLSEYRKLHHLVADKIETGKQVRGPTLNVPLFD